MYFCKGYDYGEKVDHSKESKKKNVGSHAFFRDNLATIILNERIRSDSSQLFLDVTTILSLLSLLFSVYQCYQEQDLVA